MPAKSKQQQKFMGLVHAYKKGEVPASQVSKAVKDAAKSMSKKSVKKYAKTKHDDLPKKVTEEKIKSKAITMAFMVNLDKFNKECMEIANEMASIKGDGVDSRIFLKQVKKSLVPLLKLMKSWNKTQQKNPQLTKEACQKGYMTHPTRKTKIMFGKRYRNCVKKEDTLPSPSRKLVKKMKKKGNTSVPYGSGYKKVNETPYELGGMKVYSKADGLKKVKSMKKTAGAKIYKVTKTKTKLYGTNPVTMYNLYTKNKNHSTRQNPYGLDMMKGVYLIPIKESVNEKMRPAVKKLLKQKGYSPIFQAIDNSKRQFKQMRYSRGEIQDTLIDMFGDEDPKILQKIKESVNEYTYGVGDIVKDINPTCPHNGAMGKIKSISPKSVVFVVMNKGKNYQPGDVLDKSHDQMKKMNEISNSEAKTLLKQLGGRRFMMMVGAKGIARDKDGLHMKIGRNSKSISHVVIDYNRGRDLYDMKFLRVRKSGSQMKVKTIKHVKGIYADQLHDTFEKHTGLYTRM